MIVLEGPDGAGKTTLLNYLLESCKQLEKGPRASDSLTGPVSDLAGWVDKDLASWLATPTPRCRVYDRYPLISEPIYGPICRDKLPKEFTGSWMRARLRHFRAMALVIFVLPPLKDVREALKVVPGQMDGVAKHINGIWAAYNHASSAYTGRGVHYDRTRNPMPIQEVCVRVHSHIEKWNSQ